MRSITWTVSGNTITTTGGGITGTDLQNCTLADNRITHTGAATETTVGILLHGSSGNLIEKNTCTALHNGLKCMDASHSNELRSNTVTNSRSSAVCIVDSNGVEVTENTIRTGTTNGIFVQRSKKARLLRNTIQAMGHNGICLAEKSTAATGSNRISGCPSLWDEFPAGNRPDHRGRSAYRQHQGAGDRSGQQEYEVLNHRQYPPGRRPGSAAAKIRARSPCNGKRYPAPSNMCCTVETAASAANTAGW